MVLTLLSGDVNEFSIFDCLNSSLALRLGYLTTFVLAVVVFDFKIPSRTCAAYCHGLV